MPACEQQLVHDKGLGQKMKEEIEHPRECRIDSAQNKNMLNLKQFIITQKTFNFWVYIVGFDLLFVPKIMSLNFEIRCDRFLAHLWLKKWQSKPSMSAPFRSAIFVQPRNSHQMRKFAIISSGAYYVVFIHNNYERQIQNQKKPPLKNVQLKNYISWWVSIRNFDSGTAPRRPRGPIGATDWRRTGNTGCTKVCRVAKSFASSGSLSSKSVVGFFLHMCSIKYVGVWFCGGGGGGVQIIVGDQIGGGKFLHVRKPPPPYFIRSENRDLYSGGILFSSFVNVIIPFGRRSILFGPKTRKPQGGYIIWKGIFYLGRVHYLGGGFTMKYKTVCQVQLFGSRCVDAVCGWVGWVGMGRRVSMSAAYFISCVTAKILCCRWVLFLLFIIIIIIYAFYFWAWKTGNDRRWFFIDSYVVNVIERLHSPGPGAVQVVF